MRAERILEALARGRVAVIGDLMLDRYVSGAVERISPEAPVPVLRAAEERATLGAAGNVAANIAALGGAVELVGLLGEDEEGREVARLVAALERVRFAPVVCAALCTTTKTRIICGQQQIVRIDRERPGEPPAQAAAALADHARAAIAATDVVVLADYGKGVLGDGLLALALGGGKPVIVDPKRRDLAAYRGASFITPNRRELSEATGLPCATDEEAECAAAAAIAHCGAAILLTRSERGMSLFRQGLAPVHLPAEAREVFDVTGAGDTVAAGLALGLAAGLPVEEAMRVANEAAGVVVGKLGAAVCSRPELAAALGRRSGRAAPPAALASLAEALRLRRQWAAAGLSVGFTNGCFDLLHPGHVALLRRAAEECDRLIVGLNSDASVQRLKGAGRPLQTAAARAEVLAALRSVDLVAVFEEDTPMALIEQLSPDVLVKGADYQPHEVVGAELVAARGGRLVLVELAAGHSTTALVARAHGREGA